MLWAQLERHEQASLAEAYRRRYYTLAGYLYREDTKNPDEARAIAWREMPNLLHAVSQALNADDAVEFVDRVNLFLIDFGMPREAAVLTQHAEKLSSEKGSRAWYLAQWNRGEQLHLSGQAEKAARIFLNILNTLADKHTFERANTLAQLGRCHTAGGRPDLAEILFQEAITVNEALEQGVQEEVQRGMLHSDQAVIWFGWASNCSASCASVRSPLIAASAIPGSSPRTGSSP